VYGYGERKWESQALLAIEEKCKVSEEALFLLMGHMVRRQAVATFCCVMGIVKLQALARGREIRRSDIGIEVHRIKKKLTANVFAQKVCLFLKLGVEKILLNSDVVSLISFFSKRDACAP
ncbi:hypothetical protein HID58_090734, partial [Brassica napus]